MKILALDTSDRPLSVAVLEDEQLLVETTLVLAKKHSQTLTPVIAESLQKVGFRPKDLERIVVSDGPGSYTGLRIGVTAAKVLAATLEIDLVGVSSLELLAANCLAQTDKVLVPIFDARRENVFAGAYRVKNGKLENILPDQHLSVVQLAEFLKGRDALLIGEGAKNYQAQFKELLAGEKYAYTAPNDDLPSGYLLGLLGQQKQPSQVDTFVPRYLRLTQAEVQWMEKHPGKDAYGTYVEKI